MSGAEFFKKNSVKIMIYKEKLKYLNDRMKANPSYKNHEISAILISLNLHHIAIVKWMIKFLLLISLHHSIFRRGLLVRKYLSRGLFRVIVLRYDLGLITMKLGILYCATSV